MEINAEHEEVLRLLKQFGSDSLSYFHLQSDRLYFFSPDHRSFLSYKIYNGVALVSGDPVGQETDRYRLVQSFIGYCKSWRLKVCFISISDGLRKYLSSMNFKVKRVGEEAVIMLDAFERKLLKKRVRRAVKHSERLGIDTFFFTPGNLPPFILKQLKEISNEWLAHKGKKERGFSMTLKRLPGSSDRDCLIAVALAGNSVVGFATFMPIYQTQGYSLDLIRKRHTAPNGMNEFLIIKTLEYLKDRHVRLVTLNFATFVFSFPSTSRAKLVVSKMLAFLFKSNLLYGFNKKFNPLWESRYASFTSYRELPHTLLAVIRAEQ